MISTEDIQGTRQGTDEDLSVVKTEEFEDCFDADDCRVHDVDLEIDGDFDGSNEVLIVKGDLVVTGYLGLDETGTVIVTGGLKCKNLDCEGNLEIQGDAEVSEVVFGYYEAGISNFLGKLKCFAFLEGNHSFEYEEDQLETKHHVEFDNFQDYEGDADAVKSLLSDEALERLAPLIGISDDDADGKDDESQLLRSTGFLRKK